VQTVLDAVEQSSGSGSWTEVGTSAREPLGAA
jgi:hypothetical protein